MADKFAQANGASLAAQATIHTLVVPSDTADFASQPRAIYCATAGNIAIRDAVGNNLTYAVTAGQVLPFRPTRILATGTTATCVAWE